MTNWGPEKRGQLNLNHFNFPISFGTVQVSWSSQDQLSHLQWSESHLAGWYRVRVPKSVLKLVKLIQAYFYQGEPIRSIPWDLIDQSDWSEFQKEVYRVISEIPHGETRTYGWVAAKLGKNSAARAVGQALKKNPVPILIPCHRILSSTSLGGFMGATGEDRPEVQFKRKLLSLEEEYRNPVFSFVDSNWSSSTTSRMNGSTDR